MIRDEVDFEQPSPYDPAVCGTVRKGLYDGKVVAVRILWSQDGNGTGRANRAKEVRFSIHISVSLNLKGRKTRCSNFTTGHWLGNCFPTRISFHS